MSNRRPALAQSHALAFLVRLVVSAAVLWFAVGWVSPGNPWNTFGRAVLVSIVLSIAYYVTLAKFLWFLVLPWIVYVAIWLFVVMSAYGIGFLRALLVALAHAVLSWLVPDLFGVRTFRSESRLSRPGRRGARARRDAPRPPPGALPPGGASSSFRRASRGGSCAPRRRARARPAAARSRCPRPTRRAPGS